MTCAKRVIPLIFAPKKPSDNHHFTLLSLKISKLLGYSMVLFIILQFHLMKLLISFVCYSMALLPQAKV
jgi:hypothetical protein